MTRPQQRALIQLLRRTPRVTLERIVDDHSKVDGIEATMDRLWAQKAALAELMLRRDPANPT